MPWRSTAAHLLGVVAVVTAAAILLLTLVPFAARNFFSPPLRGYSGVRAEPFYYLVLALIPILLWLVPAFARWLARSTYGAHRALFGRSGFYVRFPEARAPWFRTTVVMALGPFAVDLLAVAEIDYYLGTLGQGASPRGLFALPGLVFLAGFITALVPGPWLVDALGIRLVRPQRVEVHRAATVFEAFLGPVGAAALFVSFITTLHSANYSYEVGLFTLAVWALRLFPPILVAVSIYRLVIEPDVLPGLQAWCDREGIPIRTDLREALEATRREAPPPRTVRG